MYAVVNTFNKPHDAFGEIHSRHATIKAAAKSDAELQAAVKKGNGRSSYMPTVIVALAKGFTGDVIDCDWTHGKDGLSRKHNRPDPEQARMLTEDEAAEIAY